MLPALKNNAAAGHQSPVKIKLLKAASLLTGVAAEGWCSGESTRLPPVWPRFNSWTPHPLWVEFVVGSCPCSRSQGFLWVLYFSTFLKKTSTKFQFNLESGPSWCSALKISTFEGEMVPLVSVMWFTTPVIFVVYNSRKYPYSPHGRLIALQPPPPPPPFPPLKKFQFSFILCF